jgi:hypothetical protein
MKVLLTSEYVGQRVHNFQGLDLGRIVELVIDRETATLSFVALSSLTDEDPGEPLMIVPWPALTPDSSGPGLLLGINRERLRRAPALQRSELPTLGDREVRAWVLSYYGFPSGRTSTLEERRLMGRPAQTSAPNTERDLGRLLEAAVSGLPDEEEVEQEVLPEAEATEEEWRRAA